MISTPLRNMPHYFAVHASIHHYRVDPTCFDYGLTRNEILEGYL